jgi:hypothetical protein
MGPSFTAIVWTADAASPADKGQAMVLVDERELLGLEQELAHIDAVMARRPALDKPSRAANIRGCLCGDNSCGAPLYIPPSPPPRRAVLWFAGEMESKLRANDHKSDWLGIPLNELLTLLRAEVVELEQAVAAMQAKPRKDRTLMATFALMDDVVKEAADVGNFAMMIADRVGAGFGSGRR